MRGAVAFTLTLATLSSPCWAETLRCGSSLISEGATQGYVVEKCGPPDSKATFTEPLYTRRLDGTTYQNGTVSKDVWRYKREAGKFPAVLTFEEGVLRKLEFEK